MALDPTHVGPDEELSALASVGFLSPAEQAGFEQSLKRSSALRGKAAAMRDTAALLAFLPAQHKPSPRVKDRILAQISRREQSGSR